MDANERGESDTEPTLRFAPRTSTAIVSEPTLGDQFGPYQLIELIGEGGMGKVFRARQNAPVERDVALKLIRASSNTKEVRARFTTERQVLALMDHPHIATILEAGTDQAGRMYFAMEWVNGIPITEYCDAHGLSIRERVEVLIQVCEAVHHAHQKGIIHRDLKPSNILVAEYDSKANPKVIDFGLAKCIGDNSVRFDESQKTEFGQILGTLKYMSPEQASLKNSDIDTRSDIYSLGVILYELLVGQVPLGGNSLRDHDLTSILALIREKDSIRPSNQLALQPADLAATVLANRKIEFSQLTKELVGDLDWIVIKAIEKDRKRRYESAAEFATDLRSYLSGAAVQARPPSTSYRLKKFVQKNKLAFGFSFGIVCTLVAGIVGASLFALAARDAERRASDALKIAQQNAKIAERNRQQSMEAVDEFFTTVSEEVLLDQPGLQSLRANLLGKATKFYEDLATSEDVDAIPISTEARIRHAILLNRLGDSDGAIEQLRNANLDLAAVPQRLETIDWRAQRLEVLVRLAAEFLAVPDLDQAREHLDQASRYAEILGAHWRDSVSHSDHSGMRSAPTPEALGLPFYYLVQADLALATGNSEVAVDWVEKGLALINTNGNHSSTLSELDHVRLLEKLGGIVFGERRHQALEEAIAIRRRLYEQEENRLHNALRLASALKDSAFETYRSEPDEALAKFEEAESYLKVLHRDNPSVQQYQKAYAQCLDLHGYALQQLAGMGAAGEAAEKREKSLAKYRKAAKTLGVEFSEGEPFEIENVKQRDLPLVAMIANGIGLVFRDDRNKNAMVQRFEDAIRVQEKIANANSELSRPGLDRCGTELNLGRSLAMLGDIDAGLKRHKNALTQIQRLRERFPSDLGIFVWQLNMSCSFHEILLDAEAYDLYLEKQFDLRELANQVKEAIGSEPEQYQQAYLFYAFTQLLQGDAGLMIETLEQYPEYQLYDLNTATFLSRILQNSAAKEPLSDADQSRVFLLAQELLERAIASEEWSREDLLKEPELAYLLNRPQNR